MAVKLTAGLIAPISLRLPLTIGQATSSRLIGSSRASTPLARALALLYALLRPLIDLLILRGRRTADRDLELLMLRKELLPAAPKDGPEKTHTYVRRHGFTLPEAPSVLAIYT